MTRWYNPGVRLAIPLSLLFLIACTATPTPASQTGMTSWVELDTHLPRHATITALAASPGPAPVLYAASYDTVGLYTSPDRGVTWRADNRDLPAAPVFALLPMEGEMFAGTADGLYRRAWSADHWQRADPVPQVAIYAMAADADGTLYVTADTRGVWATSDRAGWRRLAGLDDEPLVSVLPVGSTLLAGTAGHGLWRTTDGGASWHSVSELRGEYVTLLAPDPAHGNRVYARGRAGLFRSDDTGATWTRLASALEREIVNTIWFESGRLLVGTAGGGIWWSADDGATWNAAQVENPRRRAVLALLRVGKTLYAGTFDGILESNDAGAKWLTKGQGPGSPLIHDLVMDSTRGRWLVAAEDGLYAWRAGELPLRLDLGVDDVPVLSVALAPDAPNRVYAGTDGRGVFVSDDGGGSWAAVGGDLGGRTRVPQLAVARGDGETVLARLLFERLYRSTNGGDDWRAVWTGMPVETQVQTMALAPSDDRYAAAGGDTALWFSEDGGVSWRGGGLEGRSTLALLFDPGDQHHLWAGTTSGLYETSDGARSWSSSRLPGLTVQAIASGRAGELYLGSAFEGVYRCRASICVPVGLASTSVSQIVFDPAAGQLYALTPQGLFATSVR